MWGAAAGAQLSAIVAWNTLSNSADRESPEPIYNRKLSKYICLRSNLIILIVGEAILMRQTCLQVDQGITKENDHRNKIIANIKVIIIL